MGATNGSSGQSTGQCIHTCTHHTDKVQSVLWHPLEASILLTGSYDKTVAVCDARAPDKVLSITTPTKSDVEQLQWISHQPTHFLVRSAAITTRLVLQLPLLLCIVDLVLFNFVLFRLVMCGIFSLLVRTRRKFFYHNNYHRSCGSVLYYYFFHADIL